MNLLSNSPAFRFINEIKPSAKVLLNNFGLAAITGLGAGLLLNSGHTSALQLIGWVEVVVAINTLSQLRKVPDSKDLPFMLPFMPIFSGTSLAAGCIGLASSAPLVTKMVDGALIGFGALMGALAITSYNSARQNSEPGL